MRDKLLNYLCCPGCRGELNLAVELRVGEEIKEGFLTCGNCQARYKITNFIPRFVSSDQYAANFSFEWQLYNRTQLDSANRTRESKDTFFEKTGFSPEELKGKVILDGGCGMGRFLEVAQPYAQEVIGVDLSLAVESALVNLRQFANVHIIQADLFALPLKKEICDFIYSIGVLHHTPGTQAAFKKLLPHLKTGGTIAIWVYSNETAYTRSRNWWTDLYRHFTVPMPKRLLWLLCHLAIPFYYLKKIPKVGTLLDRIFPMSNHPVASWRVLDTYDWYSPKYQWKHTSDEVTAWFKEEGLAGITTLSFPVSVKGRKL